MIGYTPESTINVASWIFQDAGRIDGGQRWLLWVSMNFPYLQVFKLTFENLYFNLLVSDIITASQGQRQSLANLKFISFNAFLFAH